MKNQITIFERLPFTIDWKGILTQNSNITSVDCDVHEILAEIKEETFKGKITLLRDLHRSGSPRYDTEKKSLPYIMFTGTFSQYSTSGFKSPSGLACLDLDHIPDIVFQDEWNKIISSPYTFAAFRSPSGVGIKALVQLENNTDKLSHKEYVDALKDYFDSPYWDGSSNQLIRGCFMTSDPDLYLNDDAHVWNQRKQSSPQMFSSTVQPGTYIPKNKAEEAKAMKVMEGGWSKWAPMTPGYRHDSSFIRAREMAEFGLSEEYAQEYMMGFVDDTFTEYEASKQVREAYQKTREKGKFGSKTFHYKPQK